MKPPTISDYKQVVEDLLVTAFEGGSNYWYMIDNKDLPKDIYKYIIEEHGTLNISDIETGDSLGTLTLTECIKGLEQMQYEYKESYANIYTENFDANDADIFLQLAVMGEVIYG